MERFEQNENLSKYPRGGKEKLTIFNHEKCQREYGAECGKEITLDLLILRHGRRDGGYLTEEGRVQVDENIRDLIKRKMLLPGDYDLVRPISSFAGPKDETSGLPRSAESAEIAVDVLTGTHVERAKVVGIQPELSYEETEHEPNFNYTAIYEGARQRALESGKEPEEAEHAAQIAVFNKLCEPESEPYTREAAGALARVILYYKNEVQHMPPNTAVMLVAGTHSGHMEWLLKHALVWRGNDEKEHIGFSDFDSIGGPFNTAESYKVSIRTDSNGEIEKIAVRFNNPNRSQEEMYLNLDTVQELARDYEALHASVE